MSNKRKRKSLKKERAEKKVKKTQVGLQKGLQEGTIIPVDQTKVFSRSVLPTIPAYYRDKWFTCKDCGEDDLWTARQQQRWYEEQGGEIEAIAICCRSCRQKEKLRKEQARRIHLEGLQNRSNKKAEQVAAPDR